MPLDLNNDNFKDAIDNNDIVVLDFWAPWCGPCKSFGPIFEKVASENPDITFAKINTEKEQELGGMFAIRSIPTLMIFREQIAVFSQPGALPEGALNELIGKVKALDMDEVRSQIATMEEEEAEKA